MVSPSVVIEAALTSLSWHKMRSASATHEADDSEDRVPILLPNLA